MRIYKITDKIEFKVGNLSFKVSPLSLLQKVTLESLMQKATSKNLDDITQATSYALKCGLKEVKGFEDAEGNPYELQFDDNGELTQSCIDELMNIQETMSIVNVCSNLLNGTNFEKLPDGVSLVESKLPKKKAK